MCVYVCVVGCEYVLMCACVAVKQAVYNARKIRVVAKRKDPLALDDQSLPRTIHICFFDVILCFITLFRSIAPSPLTVENSPGTGPKLIYLHYCVGALLHLQGD